MVEQTTRYGIAVTVQGDVAHAIARTKEELGREGFGVLSEIDIAATLTKKLDVDFRPIAEDVKLRLTRVLEGVARSPAR